MLVIRMQRTGRKGHAQFRVVVQDARRTPTSGKIVTQLGHFDPHSKQTVIDKDKTEFYLEHGAQPSERVVRLLKSENVKLPAWVAAPAKKSKSIKNVEKLRKNRPAEAETPADKPVDTKPTEEPAATEPTDAAPEAEASEALTEEAPVEEATPAETNEPAAEPTEEAKLELEAAPKTPDEPDKSAA